MTHNPNVKILAVVGLAGAGKSTAVEYLTNKGYPRVYFGGVIYSAMEKAGIEITPESQTIFRETIREKEGKDFVVKRIIKEINDLIEVGQHKIVADGIYSWTEYKAMKSEFPGELTVVGVVAPKRLRHHRLNVRPDRPFTDKESNDRDWNEIENLEKGGPIAIADYYIVNDSGVEKVYQELDHITEEIGF